MVEFLKNLYNNFTTNKLYRSVGIYTITNFINAGIPFLLMIILTRFLTTSDYGIIANYQALFNIVVPFVGYNITGAISRQYFEKDKIDFPNYVTNCIYILLFSIVPLTLAFLAFQDTIVKYTQIGNGWIYTIIVYSLCFNFIQIDLTIWQVSQKPIRYGVFKIVRTILELSLASFFVIFLSMAWRGQIIGQLLAGVLLFFVTLFFLYKEGYIKHGLNKIYIKNALFFGLPLILHVIGPSLVNLSDRIMITKFVSISETGLYSVGYQVGAVIGLLQNSFNLAWVPWFYEQLKTDKEQQKLKIVKFTYLYFLFLLVLVVLFSIIAPLIFKYLLGKAFTSAYIFVFWIALGFAFNGMYKMVVNYIFFIQKTYIIGFITIIIALLNIILDYFTIKHFGSIGSAYGCAAAFFIQFVLIWIVSAKMYKMPWFYFLKAKKI